MNEDGMRAMSKKEMEEIALRQAAGMRNAGIMAGNSLRGQQQMQNQYGKEVLNMLHVSDGKPRKKQTMLNRIASLFRKWLDKF